MELEYNNLRLISEKLFKAHLHRKVPLKVLCENPDGDYLFFERIYSLDLTGYEYYLCLTRCCGTDSDSITDYGVKWYCVPFI